MSEEKKIGLGLYIHVPFCGKICDYCDFFAISAPERIHLEYLDLVSREILTFSESRPGLLEQVETVYIGGGTPSVLSPELLQRFFSVLRCAGVPLEGLREFTMEFNPESCTEDRLSVAMENGVNRASLGIQSFDSSLLSQIGRRHTADVGENALKLLSSTKNLRVSADLMFNLPGQSLESFLSDLERLSDYPLGHISFYGLKVDPASRLGRRIERGELSVDEDLYAPMYAQGVERLAGKGFERYETSNFAREGQESLHNLNYWRRGEYLAFGPGAHGFLDGVRFYAPEMYARWREYVRKGLPRDMLTLDVVGHQEAVAECIQLSLRTKCGLNLRELASMGASIDSLVLNRWLERGYITRKEDVIVLCGEGWLFMDRVVEDLYCNCRVEKA